MGSVPNCQKEIPTRHAIRWFKCKLKPPENRSRKDNSKIDKDPPLKLGDRVLIMNYNSHAWIQNSSEIGRSGNSTLTDRW